MEPQPRYRDGEAVWFLQVDTGVRVSGVVNLTAYQLGQGYLYQVRVSPMAVYWVAEDNLHHNERGKDGE